MASEKKIAVIEPEAKEQAEECCAPACGPTTCEPGAEAVEAKAVEPKAEEKPKESSSGCGPSICSYAAAFMYGTEEPDEHKEKGKWTLPPGGLTGPSGRILFSEVVEVDVK